MKLILSIIILTVKYFNKVSFFCCSWMTVRGAAVTGTVLLDMEFCNFLCTLQCYPPLTFKRNTMFDLSPFLYVTDLAAEMEGLSSHVITRCVTSFSTSHDGPYLLTTYTENSSPTRAASDERKRYVRGGVYWRLEETSSSGAYGEVKLTPSLTSDFLTQTVTPTRRSQ